MREPQEIQETAAQVLGHSAFNKPAAWKIRFAAAFTDLSWIFILTFFLAYFVDLFPIPSLKTAFFSFLLVLGLWIAQTRALGATLGQWVWQLRRVGRKTILKVYLSPSKIISAIFLTAFFTAFTFLSLYELWRSHPLFLQPEEIKLSSNFDEMENDKTKWATLPFFYSIGLWPVKVGGHPVLYSFPYEKGPPTRFPGHIIARWNAPHARLIAHGPFTPASQASPSALKQCFFTQSMFSKYCLGLKKNALARHIKEMKKIKPEKWSLHWFETENKAIGIRLIAESETQGQERYILLHPSGAEQTFSLERPNTDESIEARRLLEKSIHSLQLTTTLDAGRNLINQKLSKMQLEELEKIDADSDLFLSKMAEIQALLLSKISVDPKVFDTYFHLGGTALLFSRKATQLKNPEWNALADPLIHSALRYAEDISPQDPRTEQLRKIWNQAKEARKSQ